jgi:hypothetical protein
VPEAEQAHGLRQLAEEQAPVRVSAQEQAPVRSWRFHPLPSAASLERVPVLEPAVVPVRVPELAQLERVWLPYRSLQAWIPRRGSASKR